MGWIWMAWRDWALKQALFLARRSIGLSYQRCYMGFSILDSTSSYTYVHTIRICLSLIVVSYFGGIACIAGIACLIGLLIGSDG